ncbi:MAG: CCA tRNA nucleotidyltransferase [Lachnospiraceae bacterium]|nr:CCA tRNA nucleotidyltransferase [Lachnospiraceae bacterium]
MTKICMPIGAEYIIEQLNKHGYEAYIVGGCVRDSLLDKNPNDWDITTSATPLQVKEIFKRTVDTGIQHGTVTVLVDKDIVAKGRPEHAGIYAFEVTTYRIDGKYEDHRRPTEVLFTASLEEDLKRRDFTINAMAYNDTDGVIDIFGGIDDLNNHVVRCVGNPSDRFDEDALRILRAVRFAAQLGFEIAETTRVAMKEQAKYLRDISAERIQVELTKLITSDNPKRLVEAYNLGITEIILPEFDEMMRTEQNNPHHLYSVGMHTIKVMENVPNTPAYRYAALFHDVGKPACKHTGEDGIDHFYGHHKVSEKMAKDILRRLKMDNATINQVSRTVLYHDYGISWKADEISIKAFRRFVAKLGIENAADFFVIREADIAGQSDYRLEDKNKALNKMKELYNVIKEEAHCLKISDLAIDGKVLMDLGMKPGKDMGDMLSYLLELVLDEPKLNEKEKLISLVEDKLKN